MGPRPRPSLDFSRPALVLAGSLGLLVVATGCPQNVSSDARPGAKKHAKGPTKADPRVVADTDDLYPQRREGDAAPTRPENKPAPATPGRGKPDETNGVCRLFAPDHPEPACCKNDLGFDVETVQTACGKRMYLGESHYSTCGYYFMPGGGGELDWYRLSYAMGDTVEKAAADHDERMRIRMQVPNFQSKPVPGVPGAMWSSNKGLHWAFIPGWPRVRQLAWRDDHCSEEGVAAIIKQLSQAETVTAGSPRDSLIPSSKPRSAASTPTEPKPKPEPTPKPEPKPTPPPPT